MKLYYLGNIPFNGEDAISHGRTKGSKNGISTTQGYKAIGQLAKGHVGSIGNAVSWAYGRASSSVSSGYAKAKKKATKAYGAGKEYITGKNAKSKLYNAEMGRLPSNAGRARAAMNMRDDIRFSRGMASAHKRDARSALNNYGNLPEDQQSQALKKNRSHMNAAARETKKADDTQKRLNQMNREIREENRKAYSEARRDYYKTLPGKMENAKKNLKKSATKSMNDVRSWLSSSSSNVSGAVRSAASTIRSSGSKAVSAIKTGASSTAGKVKNLISGLFGRKKK